MKAEALLPLLMILAAFLGPGGCSTIPSPLIVGNTYTNFEYEFSLDLPDGWMPASDPSDALAHRAPWVDEGMASLVLINDESQSVIAVLNQRNRLPFPRYIDLDIVYWERRIDAMRARLDARVEVQRYDYQIYKDNLLTTQQNYFLSQRAYRPAKVFGVDGRIVEEQMPKRLIFEWYLFPCQKDRSCQTIVMMSCREDRLEVDRTAFDHVVATLRAHDYYN